MTDKLRIALAQLNPVVGDIAGNLEKAVEARRAAEVEGAELVVFTELFLTGYPPEDLVLKRAFQDAARAAAIELARQTGDGGPGVLIGSPGRADAGTPSNAAPPSHPSSYPHLTFPTTYSL